MTIDRSEVSRALAKAIAFKNVGKDREASIWARKLVELLECAEILNDYAVDNGYHFMQGNGRR